MSLPLDLIFAIGVCVLGILSLSRGLIVAVAVCVSGAALGPLCAVFVSQRADEFSGDGWVWGQRGTCRLQGSDGVMLEQPACRRVAD